MEIKKQKILVTGGAGFIGSHLVDKLIEEGHKVTIIDKLDPQVHPEGRPPKYLNKKAEFIKADILQEDILKKALRNVDVIYHLAASTGVGQSMYEIKEYVNNNIQATAALWDILANTKHSVKKFILASSRAVYGEGLYQCKNCKKEVLADSRAEKDLENHVWEVRCPACAKFMTPLYNRENVSLNPTSIYAITKKAQEEISLCVGGSIGLPVVALRFSNVYGPRQSLSNPYVGIISIFASRLINKNPIFIYEDGLESRDFIYVKDIAIACTLAMRNPKADNQIFNVGSGEIVNVLDVANTIIKELKSKTKPKIIGKYRVGDIRHSWVDISKIKKLGLKPRYSFEQGIGEFIRWVQTEKPADFYQKAEDELKKKGLFK